MAQLFCFFHVSRQKSNYKKKKKKSFEVPLSQPFAFRITMVNLLLKKKKKDYYGPTRASLGLLNGKGF